MRRAEDRDTMVHARTGTGSARPPMPANDNDPFEPPPAVGTRVAVLQSLMSVAAGAVPRDPCPRLAAAAA